MDEYERNSLNDIDDDTEETNPHKESDTDPRVTKFSSVLSSVLQRQTAVREWYLLLVSLLCGAEALYLIGYPEPGLLVHLLILVTTVTAVQYSPDRTASIFQSLLLVPLFRVVSLGLPSLSANPLHNLAIIYVLWLISVATVVRFQELGMEGLGLTLSDAKLLFPGVMLGLPLGIGQYTLLSDRLTDAGLLGKALVTIFLIGMFIAFIEELVLRGMIQQQAEGVIGNWTAIASVGALSGFMQSVWLSPLNVLFIGVISICFGWLYSETNNLWLVFGAHAGLNAGALVLAPLYFEPALTSIGV